MNKLGNLIDKEIQLENDQEIDKLDVLSFVSSINNNLQSENNMDSITTMFQQYTILEIESHVHYYLKNVLPSHLKIEIDASQDILSIITEILQIYAALQNDISSSVLICLQQFISLFNKEKIKFQSYVFGYQMNKKENVQDKKYIISQLEKNCKQYSIFINAIKHFLYIPQIRFFLGERAILKLIDVINKEYETKCKNKWMNYLYSYSIQSVSSTDIQSIHEIEKVFKIIQDYFD